MSLFIWFHSLFFTSLLQICYFLFPFSFCFVFLNALKHKRIESFIQLCWYSIISCPVSIVLKWYVRFFLSALLLHSLCWCTLAQTLFIPFSYDNRVLLTALTMNNCYCSVYIGSERERVCVCFVSIVWHHLFH